MGFASIFFFFGDPAKCDREILAGDFQGNLHTQNNNDDARSSFG